METNIILQKLKIESLNAMQREAAQAIHSGSDVLVLSPTGSGKTLAYLLPLTQLIHAEDSRLQAIVIVPGRELALQSATVLKDMGSGLRTMALYGGRPTMDEHRKMREVQPQIVFATPGRLNDHFDKGNLSPEAVRWLVIDEFDKCLSMGFHDEMQRAIAHMPTIRQRVLLSATESEQIPNFVNMRRCKRVDYNASAEADDAERQNTPSERITIHEVKSPTKDKLETLSRLLRLIGDESSIVFLNYRDSVERVNNYLLEEGFVTSCFHGGLEQKQREDALYKFSNGSANVLVSTDLASRGLDIPDIQNIVHYHLPESEDGYIHRVGRTARWDAAGRTFFILNSSEHIPDYVEGDVVPYAVAEPQQTDPPLPRMATLYIGKGKKDKISKGDIVGFLCKTGGLKADEIGRIDVKDRYAYAAVKREKLKQVLRQTQGEKIKGIKTIIEQVK
jgi:superfamily II DNA/RNA helicase